MSTSDPFQAATDILNHLQTGFSSASRLYDLGIEGVQEASAARQLSSGFGAGQTFMVEAWCGLEALHTTAQWDLLVLSLDAHLCLDSLLGKTCQLHTTLADGTRSTRSGLINQVELLGSDGGLARHRLQVVDWTWMLSQSTASRVWEDKAVLDIIGSIFTRYTPQAAWRVSAEVGPFLAEAHQASVRSYCVQYRETDLAFVQRLLASEGLSWRIEEHDESPARHRLVIFADSTQKSAFPEDATSAHALAGQGIRFHRGHAQETQDSWQALSCQHYLPSAVFTLLNTDYKTKQSISASAPTAKVYGGKNAPRLERYHPGTPYGAANRQQAERRAELGQQALEARHQRWFARGTVRTLRAGTRFTLSQAPLPELQKPDYPGFNVLSVKHLGLNNLPKPATDALAELLGDAPELLAGLLQELQVKSTSSAIAACASSYKINSAGPFGSLDPSGPSNPFDASTAAPALEANSKTGSAAAPLIVLDFGVGSRIPEAQFSLEEVAVRKPLDKATLSEPEAVALWDVVVPTLRPRPGRVLAAGGSTSVHSPPATPLKSLKQIGLRRKQHKCM